MNSADIQLLQSSMDDNIAEVIRSIDAGGNVNMRDPQIPSSTPLLNAIQNDAKMMVSYLLKNGANPNINCDINRPGISAGAEFTVPLQQAIAHKVSPEILQDLIAYGANPSHIMCNRKNMMTYAAQKQNSEALITMFLAGINIMERDGMTLNAMEIDEVDLKCLQILHCTGRKPEMIDVAMQMSSFGNDSHDAPIFHAIRLGDVQVITHLIDNGEDLSVSAKSLPGMKPMEFAFAIDRQDIGNIINALQAKKMCNDVLVDMCKTTPGSIHP